MNEQQAEVSEIIFEYDIVTSVIFGVIGVLLGWLIAKGIKKPQSKNEINFSVCLSLCFSGTLVIFREIIEFFIDFYTGSNLLKADFVPDSHWLYRLVGFGKSPYEQRPLLDTDEDMLLSLLGAVFTALILYACQRRKNKELYIRAKAVKKEPFDIKLWIREKIISEKAKLEKDCTIADILLWWCTRALMLYAFFTMEVRAEANLLLANLVATFAITLIHLVFPSKSFFAKVSYRIQSLLTVIVFLGSYCGNYIMVYYIVPRFDLFLHFISGILCVAGGYYIALSLIKADSNKNISLICLFAFCLSCLIMPAWEVSEFIGDFIWGTSNQGFYWGPSDDSFLFILFGRGAYNTDLYYLYDTFYDVLLALSTTVPSTVILYIYLKVRSKKKVKELNAEKCLVAC